MRGVDSLSGQLRKLDADGFVPAGLVSSDNLTFRGDDDRSPFVQGSSSRVS